MLVLTKTLKAKGIPVLEVSGTQEIRLQCPQCKKQKLQYEDAKLYFNTLRKVGHCKRCEWSGGWIKLLKLLNMKSLKAPTPSLEDLRERSTEERDGTVKQAQSILPRKVVPAWSHERARRYLRGRGFTRRSAERAGFLYCTGGYFQNRLIIPIFDEHGKYRTFAARYLEYFIVERYLRKSGQSGSQKYLYPKGFHVSRILGDLYPNQKALRRRYAILVEGRFDSLHLAPYGCCVFGTNISASHIQLLREARVKRVVICFDHDTKKRARQNVRESIQRAKTRLRKYFEVGVIWLPQRPSDPTDYSPRLIFKWAKRSLKQTGFYTPKRFIS